MATISNNTVTLEDSDVLNLFSAASAVITDLTDGDVQYTTDFLVEAVETDTSGNETVITRIPQKVTAAALKAYLTGDLVEIDSSGNLVINGETTDLNVDTPVIMRMDGTNLQYSTDGGTTYTTVMSTASYIPTSKIVNNHTTGGSTNVLSAAEGKNLYDNYIMKFTASTDTNTYPDY